jgi:two-component system cell cycle sensor histidine kinase PleC
MTRPRGAMASAMRWFPESKRSDAAALAGHARLFAHPAYTRLVNSEPYVKRLVPILIILFVLALGGMRAIAVFQAHTDIEESAALRLQLIAKAVAGELSDAGTHFSLATSEGVQGILENSLPPLATAVGRRILLVNPEGRITATAPGHSEVAGNHFDDIVGGSQPLTTLGDRAGVLRLTLASGEDVLATVHHVNNAMGSIAVLQPLPSVFSDWRRTVSREAAVFVATSIVLVILGFAFHAQAARAEEADCIYSETQNRFHTALRRGHSGLWEWDLSRGAIFWSPSMFEILGLRPQKRLLSVGEVAALSHPEDVNLVELANELLANGHGQLDREFRMRHAEGHWIWIGARAELVSDAEEDRHLVGIAVDITEQKRLAEASRTADMRLEDAINAISEAFVLWDSANRLVMCNRKYQQLYDLPDELVRPGTPYAEIARNGRPPTAAATFTSDGEDRLGARSVEARVDDGRWLQINERRTQDGGFVSVGTDITALKRHEAQLLENERALTATVEIGRAHV